MRRASTQTCAACRRSFAARRWTSSTRRISKASNPRSTPSAAQPQPHSHSTRRPPCGVVCLTSGASKRRPRSPSRATRRRKCENISRRLRRPSRLCREAKSPRRVSQRSRRRRKRTRRIWFRRRRHVSLILRLVGQFGGFAGFRRRMTDKGSAAISGADTLQLSVVLAIRLASRKGIEPLTPGLGNLCSILLSYRDVVCFRALEFASRLWRFNAHSRRARRGYRTFRGSRAIRGDLRRLPRD